MALDLARGLQALHEAPGGPIVHFDIKPQQMMMDADGKLRINDLNLVRFPDADKDGNSCPFKCGASGVGESQFVNKLSCVWGASKDVTLLAKVM